MKLKFFAICLLLLLPFSAFGDEKVELAKEIMELTNANQLLEQVGMQVKQMQSQVMAQFEIPEDKKEQTLKFQNKVRDKIFEIMAFDKMENEYIELFASVYTIDELKEMVGFYRSPVGRSMVAKQPIIIKKAMEMSQRKLQVLIPELQKMSEEFEQELKNQ